MVSAPARTDTSVPVHAPFASVEELGCVIVSYASSAVPLRLVVIIISSPAMRLRKKSAANTVAVHAASPSPEIVRAWIIMKEQVSEKLAGLTDCACVVSEKLPEITATAGEPARTSL